MAEAIDVYLDSQDFSRLSPSNQNYGRYEGTRDRLIALRDQGKARYLFSDVHIFECMPMERTKSDYGLERIRTIAELCGRHNLPSVSVVVEGELSALMGRPPPKIWKEWYPHFEVPGPDVDQINREVISELGSNRKQRRMMASVLRNKGRHRIRGDEFAKQVVQKYPFMEGGRAVLKQYLEGRRPWEDVLRALYDGMRDIASFSEWLVENWEQGQSFVQGLRSGNERTRTLLIDFHTKMRSSHAQSRLPSDLAVQALRSVYEGKREEHIRLFLARLAERAEASLGVPASENVKKFDQVAPSLNYAFTLITEILYHTALPNYPLNPNKRSGSDFADALHIFHAPSVDIFRADKFVCSVMGRLKHTINTTFCESLVDLPSLIEERHGK